MVSHLEPCHGTCSERAPGWVRRAVRVDGAAPCGLASLAVGRAGPGLFGSVAGPWQAKCAQCVWAALGFQRSGWFKFENFFSIFFQFEFEFKLLKFVSKYPELQNFFDLSNKIN
jgi:hypothetical protein